MSLLQPKSLKEYRLSDVEGNAAERRRLATFLADFVKSGGLRTPRPGDDDNTVWEQRMSWWWDHNPNCDKNSPKGTILENHEGEIVGFNGFIPVAYEVNGNDLPTLVTTTFFVLPDHRSAVMGMLMRQRKLAQEYQIIDGSPSPEMRRLLEKLKYKKAGHRSQWFFPTWRTGGAVTRTLLRWKGWSSPLPPKGAISDYRSITDPLQWEAGPPILDGTIRWSQNRRQLHWVRSVGSEQRQFFGLLSPEGEPVAHAIGLYKPRAGFRACLLLDHREYQRGGMGKLIRWLLSDPDSTLDPTCGMIVLSGFGDSSFTGAKGHQVDSILYYHLPESWQQHPKLCLPIEGDLPLL